MSVILFLLKWIGILLMILLCLLLLLLLLLLFVPVRYEGSFEKQETMSGFAKVTWFFRAFELSFSIEEETVIKARVLFWNLYDSKKEEKEMQTKPVLLEAREKKEPKKEKKKKEVPKPKEKSKEPVKQERKSEIHLEKEEKQEKPQEFRRIKVSEVKETPPKQLEEKKETEINQAQVKRIKMKETAEAEEIEKEEEEKKEKKEEKLDFDYLKNMPNKKDTIKLVVKFIKRVLKQVFPRWIEIEGEIGTGEPALTGQALALAGISSAVLHIHAHVKGNFEKQMIQGAVKAKGRIFLGAVCYASLCFIFARPIWKIVKLYLKG